MTPDTQDPKTADSKTSKPDANDKAAAIIAEHKETEAARLKAEGDQASLEAARQAAMPKPPSLDPNRKPIVGDKVRVFMEEGSSVLAPVVEPDPHVASPSGQIAVEVELAKQTTVLHKSHSGVFPYWEWPE